MKMLQSQKPSIQVFTSFCSSLQLCLVFFYLSSLQLAIGFFSPDDNCVVLFADLLLAGSDTTSNVTNFTLLHLVCNQDIQEKVYEEIRRVVGNNRLPDIEDRSL